MSVVTLVAGLGALSLAIVERLRAAGAEVRAIASPDEARRLGHELERLGVPVTTGSARSAGTLRAVGVESAAVLLLAADEDAENVDAALAARRLRHDLPLVVRLFDTALVAYLEETLPRAVFLSMSGVAAPVFVAMALRALAERAPAEAGAPRGRAARRTLGRPRVDRTLRRVAPGLAVCVALAVAYFAYALELRVIDAFYFVGTTVTTVGYGDIALRDASDPAKLVGVALMVAGAALLAVLYALVAEQVLARRLRALRGRVPTRERGHVVVTGAGNIGFRVAGALAERGHRVVIVERDGDSRNIAALQASGHHVIVGDVLVDETLELAGVGTAGVVLALTDSDATNLHTVLAVRRRNPAVPVVTRLISPELSAHVSTRHEAGAASPVAIAGEAFARAVLAAATGGVAAGPST